MKIFIDEGHNDSGHDTGAERFGLREQDVTYEIGHLLGNKLKSVGIEVGHSRSKKDKIIGKNTNDSLNQRAKMSNDFNSDLFLSLHCNSHINPNSNGTEVYVYSLISPSVQIAVKIKDKLCDALDTFDRGLKVENFLVLRQTVAPAVLVEIAFISNEKENKILKERQEEVAQAIFEAICEQYNIKLNKKETAEEIVNSLSKIIEIKDKNTAINQVQEAKDKNNSLYWILYKIVNK